VTSRRSRRRGTGRILLSLALVLLLVGGHVWGIDLGDVQVTLQSHRYYPTEDLTHFVYRVVSPSKPSAQFFVLGNGTCVTQDIVDAAASSPFEWVDEPFRGLRFESTKKNEKFDLWLVGQWNIGIVDVALLLGDPDADPETLVGEMEGSHCGPVGISIAVVSGGNPSFPAIDGPGTFAGVETTLLRVTSSTLGWTVSHALEFDIPASAWQETVARVLEVLYDAYEPSDGTTDIGVSYALVVNEEDFIGLPEGEYVISITFTAAEN